MSRRAQDAVRDQLVAAAVASRRRRRRRATAVVALLVASLGATTVAQATRLLAVGEPIETLWPERDAAHVERYGAPHGARLSVTAPDPDFRYGWGAATYTTAEGDECVLAGNVRGDRLGRERGGRFHPYGPDVVGSCGKPRLPVLLDMLRVDGPHPRTIVFGRTRTPHRPPIYEYDGELYPAEPGRGGAFLIVLEGIIAPAELRLVD